MRTIKLGHTFQWGPKEIMCHQCKSLIEVVQEDLVRWNDFCGYPNEEPCEVAGFTCPECGNDQMVEAPSVLIDRLPRKK